eukprot:Rmarinus@m.11854
MAVTGREEGPVDPLDVDPTTDEVEGSTEDLHKRYFMCLVLAWKLSLQAQGKTCNIDCQHLYETAVKRGIPYMDYSDFIRKQSSDVVARDGVLSGCGCVEVYCTAHRGSPRGSHPLDSGETGISGWAFLQSQSAFHPPPRQPNCEVWDRIFLDIQPRSLELRRYERRPPVVNPNPVPLELDGDATLESVRRNSAAAAESATGVSPATQTTFLPTQTLSLHCVYFDRAIESQPAYDGCLRLVSPYSQLSWLVAFSNSAQKNSWRGVISHEAQRAWAQKNGSLVELWMSWTPTRNVMAQTGTRARGNQHSRRRTLMAKGGAWGKETTQQVIVVLSRVAARDAADYAARGRHRPSARADEISRWSELGRTELMALSRRQRCDFGVSFLVDMGPTGDDDVPLYVAMHGVEDESKAEAPLTPRSMIAQARFTVRDLITMRTRSVVVPADATVEGKPNGYLHISLHRGIRQQQHGAPSPSAGSELYVHTYRLLCRRPTTAAVVSSAGGGSATNVFDRLGPHAALSAPSVSRSSPTARRSTLGGPGMPALTVSPDLRAPNVGSSAGAGAAASGPVGAGQRHSFMDFVAGTTGSEAFGMGPVFSEPTIGYTRVMERLIESPFTWLLPWMVLRALNDRSANVLNMWCRGALMAMEDYIVTNGSCFKPSTSKGEGGALAFLSTNCHMHEIFVVDHTTPTTPDGTPDDDTASSSTDATGTPESFGSATFASLTSPRVRRPSVTERLRRRLSSLTTWNMKAKDPEEVDKGADGCLRLTTYRIVTFGAPSPHAMGLKSGGLRKLIRGLSDKRRAGAGRRFSTAQTAAPAPAAPLPHSRLGVENASPANTTNASSRKADKRRRWASRKSSSGSNLIDEKNLDMLRAAHPPLPRPKSRSLCVDPLHRMQLARGRLFPDEPNEDDDDELPKGGGGHRTKTPTREEQSASRNPGGKLRGLRNSSLSLDSADLTQQASSHADGGRMTKVHRKSADIGGMVEEIIPEGHEASSNSNSDSEAGTDVSRKRGTGLSSEPCVPQSESSENSSSRDSGFQRSECTAGSKDGSEGLANAKGLASHQMGVLISPLADEHAGDQAGNEAKVSEGRKPSTPVSPSVEGSASESEGSGFGCEGDMHFPDPETDTGDSSEFEGLPSDADKSTDENDYGDALDSDENVGTPERSGLSPIEEPDDDSLSMLSDFTEFSSWDDCELELVGSELLQGATEDGDLWCNPVRQEAWREGVPKTSVDTTVSGHTDIEVDRQAGSRRATKSGESIEFLGPQREAPKARQTRNSNDFSAWDKDFEDGSDPSAPSSPGRSMPAAADAGSESSSSYASAPVLLKVGLKDASTLQSQSAGALPNFGSRRSTAESLADDLRMLNALSETKQRMRVQERRVMAFCQGLTALVSSFLGECQNHIHSGNIAFFRQIAEIGFLACFESLCTTAGKEKSMIEDYAVAAADMSEVAFEFVFDAPSTHPGDKAEASKHFSLDDFGSMRGPLRTLDPKLASTIAAGTVASDSSFHDAADGIGTANGTAEGSNGQRSGPMPGPNAGPAERNTYHGNTLTERHRRLLHEIANARSRSSRTLRPSGSSESSTSGFGSSGSHLLASASAASENGGSNSRRPSNASVADEASNYLAKRMPSRVPLSDLLRAYGFSSVLLGCELDKRALNPRYYRLITKTADRDGGLHQKHKGEKRGVEKHANGMVSRVPEDDSISFLDPAAPPGRFFHGVVIKIDAKQLGATPVQLHNLKSILRDQIVHVMPVFFTQGVNEQQSLANRMHESSLQDEINLENLLVLRDYCRRFFHLPSQVVRRASVADIDEFRGVLPSPSLAPTGFATFQSPSTSGSQSPATAGCLSVSHSLPGISGDIPLGSTLLRSVEHHVKDVKGVKDTKLLQDFERLARVVNGGRLTSCKSAKDRTSMAVTLEFATTLKEWHNLRDSAFMPTMDMMRSRGVRRDNVEKNTGLRKYAFNVLQDKFLPKLFRPPRGTASGSNVT